MEISSDSMKEADEGLLSSVNIQRSTSEGKIGAELAMVASIQSGRGRGQNGITIPKEGRKGEKGGRERERERVVGEGLFHLLAVQNFI